MSKILLYLDEDASDEDFVQALRSRQVDVLTAADVGMLNRSFPVKRARGIVWE